MAVRAQFENSNEFVPPHLPRYTKHTTLPSKIQLQRQRERVYLLTMATMCRVGVFSTLTNSYALVGNGASQNFYSVFEAELADVIPITHTTIAGTRIIGRLTSGCVYTRDGFGGVEG